MLATLAKLAAFALGGTWLRRPLPCLGLRRYLGPSRYLGLSRYLGPSRYLGLSRYLGP